MSYEIHIQKNPTYDVTRGESALIFFPYNEGIIQMIKSIPSARWLTAYSAWDLRLPMVRVFIRNVKRFQSQLGIQPQWFISNEFKPSTQLKCDLRKVHWKTTPFEHQYQGVEYAIKNKRFILGDEPGCGKTKIILDTFQYLKKYENVKRCLIICGVNGNKYNWAEEVSIHTDLKSKILGSKQSKRTGKINAGTVADTLADLRNLPDADVLIINIERLRGARVKRKRGQRRTIEEFPVVKLIQHLIDTGEIGLVAVDECHRVKAPTSAQTQALLWIDCPRQIAMTGTLIMNSPLDLYVPFKWMGWESRDYWGFLNRYAIKDMWGSVVGYQNAQELIDVLACYQLRRLKKDVLKDLPDKLIIPEYVELDKDEWKIYHAVQSGLLHLIQGESTNPENLKQGLFDPDFGFGLDPMTLSMRLRQSTAHTSIVSDVIQKSSKMDRMLEIVEDVVKNGGKCIVFSNWTTVTSIARNMIQKRFDEISNEIRSKLSEKDKAEFEPLKVAYITGEVTSDALRNEQRENFQNKDNYKVIIGTIPAMGTGFTLHAADTVIFLDEPWTKANRGQAEDRAHRAGVKHPVTVYILMAKDTVDEHVHEVVEGKGDIADLIVDGVVRKDKKAQLLRMLIGAEAFSNKL